MTSPDTEIIHILGASPGDSEGPSARPPARPLPEVLPILGLADIVIFPGMVAPLLVDTAPSIRLIDDVVEGDRLLGLVLQRKPESDNPTPEELWENGCAARVLKMLKFPDNTVRVLVEGLWRMGIREYETQTPYLRAKVSIHKDVIQESVELTALARSTQQKFEEIIKLSPALSDQVKVAALNTEAPGTLRRLGGGQHESQSRGTATLARTPRRGGTLAPAPPMMDRENEVLTISSKIQNEVASSMAKSQRDFFLREQIRAIQRELGEGDPTAVEVNNLREEIESNRLPEEVQKVAFKELDRLQQMPPAVAEYAVTRNYLDWLINLPWTKTTEDNVDLDTAEAILNEQHYGLKKVKDRLLEFIAVIKRRKQNSRARSFAWSARPAWAKRRWARSVADALGRKFARISLGGMRDEAEIRGHRRTYVGAMPGRIIQTLRRVESRNPVILLDEMDKVGADFRGDPGVGIARSAGSGSRTTRSPTITWICRLTCRTCCSSPPPTGSIRFIPPCATGWK